MLTIKTKPDCTLGFVKDSGPIQDIHLVNDIFSKYPLIGKLSEITEEQAKELVESLIVNGFCCYKDYIDPANTYFGASVLMSLKSAALSVGIEEEDFDKYLVIKL